MQHQNIDCTFRTATKSDYDELHVLLTDCWSELYTDRLSPNAIVRYHQEDHIGQHLYGYLDCMEVAVIGEKIVGVVSHCFGSINGLFVEKFYRGNLIGSSLLSNAVLDGARYLDVAAFNKRAKRFYERNSWRVSSTFFEDVCGTNVAMHSMVRLKLPEADVIQ